MDGRRELTFVHARLFHLRRLKPPSDGMPAPRQIYVGSLSRRERSWGRGRRRPTGWFAGSTTLALIVVGAALLSLLRV
jgi:hypothetical protein